MTIAPITPMQKRLAMPAPSDEAVNALKLRPGESLEAKQARASTVLYHLLGRLDAHASLGDMVTPAYLLSCIADDATQL